MQFPQRDLTNQYISTSYQDVVQRYADTGSTTYLLDGLGYVIISVPDTSIGSQVLTVDQTASFTASIALTSLTSYSSSWASQSFNAISASFANIANLAFVADVALVADTANSASYSDFSLTASYALTSSYFLHTCSIQTDNYSLTGVDYTVCFSGSTPLSASLPSAITVGGRIYNIKNVTTYNVTVTGSQNIDGDNNQVVTQWNNLTIQSNGTQWIIL